ncbi:MAG TPA: phosphoenolpyruvate--protein phosphotransferase [Longimicrobiales bacterium]|nr:phosphoenolpyruvate--protein phosphotransferase [Longimicrobiales bacterium]
MRLIKDGTAASPGIVEGPLRVVHWEVPRVPHETIEAGAVEAELARLDEAVARATEEIAAIKTQTEERLGSVQAQIFDPQLLMLQDEELLEGTRAYVRDNHISAARAFELKVLEFRSEWRRTGHPMVLDRLNDLLDMETRVLRALLDLDGPDGEPDEADQGYILVARDLTPSMTVQLDPQRILGIAVDAGSRTSHSAILARALHIPAIVGLRDFSEIVESGHPAILDGRAGRIIVGPTEHERTVYRERDIRVHEWERELLQLADLPAVTPDRQPILLRANIDLPGDAEDALEHGAQGIGLFRTEFLVVGRSQYPEEEEQYRAYRHATEVFPDDAVYIRTFDLGGDKYPRFLEMPPEENPFLGWRGIRVCLDVPDLFRGQLRAILRATAHGDVRIMLPMVNEIEEVTRTRAMLEEEEDRLRAEGLPYNAGYKVGIMVETPAAVLTATNLARHADFFSIGTNDLTQYTLAVDRGNARLGARFKPFHPAVLELMRRTVGAGREAGIEVSVCGDLAANPLGLFLLLGLGVTAFSVSSGVLPEVKKVARAVPIAGARSCVEEALEARTAEAAAAVLMEGINQHLDLALFSGRWSLAPDEEAS